MTAYTEFTEYMGSINDLCCVLNLMKWDEGTQMPPGGTLTRGRQVSTVAQLAHERFTHPHTLELIEAAATEIQGDAPDSYRVRACRQAREAYEVARKIPQDLVAELNNLKVVSQKVWAEARSNDDFASFAPYLERMMALTRQEAEAIGYQEHPYDALLYRYEPGMTLARLNGLFDELKQGLAPIVKRAVLSPQPRTDFLSERDYPEDQQRLFALEIAKQFGYDTDRGRLDPTVHPFEISFTRQDVRITTRYNRRYAPAAIFGTFHETGHALYEQGADPAITRTVLATDLLGLYAVAGVSYGTHESQSRLWENLVGRSRRFWQNHFGQLRACFPEQLRDVDTETFYRAINRVQPSLIRVEADEVTYNFHIMLRVEIEAGLIDGSIQVKDLPDLWKARMREYLGVEPMNNRLGVLQDIHWSMGLVGSFCTYTVGNVMSAQFYQAALKSAPEVGAGLKQGDYRPLLAWLTENIYRHGRAYSPDELLRRSTGRALSPQPYLDYLTQKFGELYPE